MVALIIQSYRLVVTGEMSGVFIPGTGTVTFNGANESNSNHKNT
jgi:hypothetical protein